MPNSNREFWEDKFARNAERDKKTMAALEAAGWTVVTIWECELRADSIEVTEQRLFQTMSI